MRVETPKSNQAQSAETQGSRKTNKTAQSAEQKDTGGAGASSGATQASVSTDISSKGKDLAKAKAVANDTPDVREAKVAELKRRIAEGKYKVDNHAIADRVVDDHLKMSDIG